MAVVSTVGGKIEVPEFTEDERAGMSANELAETEKFLGDIQKTTQQPNFHAMSTNISGIFGMPYQFSDYVDPCIKLNGKDTHIGRKFNEKIFSIMPILFLTPGEPKFMADYGNKKYKAVKQQTAARLAGMLDDAGDDESNEYDEGRYYSFESNFQEYKKYANVSLRALALYMGIDKVRIPVPGGNKTVTLGKLNIEDFLNSSFAKLFGSQVTVPFFLDAETAISESFSNGTTESALSQTVNQFSQNAREIQFIMGSKDFGGLMGNVQDAVTDVSQAVTGAMSGISDALMGKNMVSRVAGELTTIVTGGKIVFPEIWSDSDYDRSYDINIKLRSPDPDPVSIFLNVYMPIVLLISMTAPRQIGNSSNSYEAPFIVRATYKSIFSCDMGIITSLSINKGGSGNWNSMGMPTSADVTISLKDLYGSMQISKRMGLLTNTAQMDYLATMAGVDLNEFEPTRQIRLASQIIGNTFNDWGDYAWGGIKATANKAGGKIFSRFTDTRYLT